MKPLKEIRMFHKQERMIFLVMITIFFALMTMLSGNAIAGLYLNSAHGNSTYGTYRTSMGASGPGFARGNCAHCHEQHASVGGSEPDPVGGGPSNFTLFYTNYLNQTDGICVKCHTDLGSLQSGGAIVNRGFSYRAGGWLSDTVNDVLEAFSFITPGTSHNLGDIRSFLTTNPGASGWGYTTDSNPCVACHNPHAAQGDPADQALNGSSAKSSGDTNAWGLWGDQSGEKMSDYAPSVYQSPYRFNSTTAYEPAGSTTVLDGSDLTDYVTFCTDCHNSSNVISSSTMGTLRTIDWSVSTGEKHGNVDFDGTKSMDAPYASGGTVLACTDCHEPHGSPNQALIRPEVNGGALGITVSTIAQTACVAPYPSDTKEISYLCNRCHSDDNQMNGSCGTNKYYIIHHDAASGDPPYPSPGTCTNCHSSGSGSDCTSTYTPINCNCCHYHGSTVDPGGGSRKTF